MNLPVGWRNIAIKDIAANERLAFIDGDWIEAPFITTTGIRLIQTGNIGIGTFVNRNKKYISQESFDELKCKDVKVGDILICRLADPIGRSCIVPDLNGRAITSVDVCILRVDNSEYNRDFIAHALNQTTFLAACQEKSGGSTRQRISRTNLGTIEILVAEDKLEQAKINPDEVECRFRRKWNTESGGSGISIPGSGTRNPGSGTSNPEEVEHRFLGS